jgi:hypothetical protein
VSEHDRISGPPIRKQLDGVLKGHCSKLADVPAHFGFHVVFDQRFGARLRPKVVVAIVVADPEAARHAVIQLVFAVLGVRDAVCGKDAAGLGFIGGVDRCRRAGVPDDRVVRWPRR